jgi:acyl carrier protein
VSPVSAEQAVGAVNQVLGNRRGGDPVGVDDRLEDLGLDSLDVAELFLTLEELAGCQLDPASAGALERVGDLAGLRELSQA